MLHCEVPTLGYPRAALLAFSMAAVAGDALAVLKANLRVAHGPEMAAEVSSWALADEIAEVYPGMMIAVPPVHWAPLRQCGAATISRVLNEVAERMPLHRMLRSRRGPKKPRPRRSSGKRIHHVSNRKLLDQRQAARATRGRSRSPTRLTASVK